MEIVQLDHLNLSVSNLAASLDWYRRLFDFEVVEQGVQEGVAWAIARSGEAVLALYEDPGREHLDRFAARRRRIHGLNHFALRIDDRSAWEAVIDREQVEVAYGGEVSWPHSTAWYVTDPTGYEIEVALWGEAGVAFG